MIVCSCNSISDRTVRTAIAFGAHDIDALGRTCGAGTRCFGCHDTLEELLVSSEVRLPRPHHAA